MKRKSTLRKVEPPDLTLEYVDPADSTVPAPKNSIAGQHASEKVSNFIATRYEMTHRIGGLIPDQYGKGYWRCTQCLKIYETRPMAKECHHASAVQVLICTFCQQKLHQLLRIGECQCPSSTKPK